MDKMTPTDQNPPQRDNDDLREHLVEGQAIMEGLIAENDQLRTQLAALREELERVKGELATLRKTSPPKMPYHCNNSHVVGHHQTKR